MIPAAVGKRLTHKLEPWQELPIRWTRERNYHVTLAFIGHIGDESVAQVCAYVEESCASLQPFDILLDRIALVPEQGRNAEMLWFYGEANEDMRALHDELSRALGTFAVSTKAFVPHVTLGRVRERKWLELPEAPFINERFAASIPVDAVTVFESVFVPHQGLTYQPLGVYPLIGETEENL